jgi:hypothetical protein
MATQEFFHEIVKDKKRDISVDLEFGRSSFYGENSLYIIVDGKQVILSTENAKKLVMGMVSVGQYLAMLD